jgi:hypothetical protein
MRWTQGQRPRMLALVERSPSGDGGGPPIRIFLAMIDPSTGHIEDD